MWELLYVGIVGTILHPRPTHNYFVNDKQKSVTSIGTAAGSKVMVVNKILLCFGNYSVSA